ncbi:ABC transporter permease [Streptomyces sp. NPDC050560]|uniref:ABC transporter permease n=1 Tax=Streptomyces sp. NPDC050560 TaxID=3365630 RepID=UPI00379D4AC7
MRTPRPASDTRARGRRPAVAPWLRTRLRTAPFSATALALLVAVTTCLAAAFPRAVDHYQDTGLRDLITSASPERSALSYVDESLTAPSAGEADPPGIGEVEDRMRPDVLRTAYRGVRDSLTGPLAVDDHESGYGVETSVPLVASDDWLPHPERRARMTLVAQAGLPDHATLSQGRLPRAPEHVSYRTTRVEAAVSEETAERLHIKAGSLIHLPGTTVHVTGIVRPRNPSGPYWSVESVLRTPVFAQIRTQETPPPHYWLGALLLAPDAAPMLLGTRGTPVRYWRLPLHTGGLHAHELPAFKSAVASAMDGPTLLRIRSLTNPGLSAGTDLDDLIGEYEGLHSGIQPVVSVAASGTGTVALVVLLMAAALAARRRHAELALLRARGATLGGIGGRLLAETAVVSVPAGAVGLGAALLFADGPRVTGAVLAAAAVVAIACLALPLRAVAAHRTARVHAAREDTIQVRLSRRRLVAELTVLVLAAGAVSLLRVRGADSGGTAALAPVLLGVIAALALVRLVPYPLRWAARPAGRLRGAVTHLSLARAGRGAGSISLLPLLALLTALATAAFGGAVLTGVDQARAYAAARATGADARVESSIPLPSGASHRVREVPGVRDVTPVSIEYDATPADPADDGPHVPLVGVVPGAYAALAHDNGLGAFPAAALAHPSTGGTLPAVASPAVAKRYGTGRPLHLLVGSDEVTVRIAAVRDTTPALSTGDFLLVDAAGLGSAAKPTTLLLTGAHIDGKALRAAADSDTVDVRLRSEERARHQDTPMQRGADRVYTAAVAAGAGFALLALLLALAGAAPERRALLARLRTMGLTRAQGRRLLILEAIPGALLAAVGGAATGWAAVLLLRPGIDLTAVALAATADGDPVTRVRPVTDLPSLLLPALLVIALTAAVAAVQAWWTGRRGSVTELRAGDRQ